MPLITAKNMFSLLSKDKCYSTNFSGWGLLFDTALSGDMYLHIVNGYSNTCQYSSSTKNNIFDIIKLFKFFKHCKLRLLRELYYCPFADLFIKSYLLYLSLDYKINRLNKRGGFLVKNIYIKLTTFPPMLGARNLYLIYKCL